MLSAAQDNVALVSALVGAIAAAATTTLSKSSRADRRRFTARRKTITVSLAGMAASPQPRNIGGVGGAANAGTPGTLKLGVSLCAGLATLAPLRARWPGRGGLSGRSPSQLDELATGSLADRATMAGAVAGILLEVMADLRPLTWIPTLATREEGGQRWPKKE